MNSTYTLYPFLQISHTVIACNPLPFTQFVAHNKKNKGKSNANNFHPGLRPTFLLEIALEMLKCCAQKVAQIFVQGTGAQ